ncbi:MAG: ABC transporter permease subunit [Rhizobiaceae bacterium]|nr:ABC transporter permease subunit [Rhizobiaceae bacterium]
MTPAAALPSLPARVRRWSADNKGASVGVVIIAALVAMAVFADVLAPHPPYLQDRDAILIPPVWQEGGDWRFLLGTDAVGRDMLSRVIYGSRFSLAIGCLVVSLAIAMGVTLGLIAAATRGIVDTAIMRFLDMVMAIPSLLLALVIVAILGPGLFNAVLAIAIVLVPHFTRITRAAALTELTRDYVVASRMAGAGGASIMFRQVLPNCMPPVIVQATLGFSTAILDTAALGFLGMGARPPTPEWGAMLADAQEFILLAWWVVTLPGIAILLAVLAFNLLGDGLRDALDPKLRKR